MPRYIVGDCAIQTGDGVHQTGEEVELTEADGNRLGLKKVPAKSNITVKAINACKTIEAVDALMGGETKENLVKAATEKRKKLEAELVKQALAAIDLESIDKMERDELVQTLMNNNVNPKDDGLVPDLQAQLKELVKKARK